MSNFAKKQLLKYGWTEGKGLGKTESGIAEAIKPKLKFDNAGIGHDSAEQFTYHWWENVFNEAAKNVSVDSDKHGVSLKVIDEDIVSISTKKSSIKALKKNHKLQYGSFLKTSTLLNDGKVIDESIEEPGNSTVVNDRKTEYLQLTDDDLFKACGGRTAHKGARHGLNLNGKLARIAAQEKQLLAKMSLGKTEEVDSSLSVSQETDCSSDFELVKVRKRVKSKRKLMEIDSASKQTNTQDTLPSTDPSLIGDTDPQPSCSYTIDRDNEENMDALKSKRKTMKSKKNNNEPINSFQEFTSPTDSDGCNGPEITQSNQYGLDDNANTIEQDEAVIPPITEHHKRRTKSKKSKRKEKRKINDLTEQLDTACVIDESTKVSKKRGREENCRIVQDIILDALEMCGPSMRKRKKTNTEAILVCPVNEADQLNAKISRRKKYAYEKKRKDKLDSITKDLMSVNLDGNSGRKVKRHKHKSCSDPDDASGFKTDAPRSVRNRCSRHKSKV